MGRHRKACVSYVSCKPRLNIHLVNAQVNLPRWQMQNLLLCCDQRSKLLQTPRWSQVSSAQCLVALSSNSAGYSAPSSSTSFLYWLVSTILVDNESYEQAAMRASSNENNDGMRNTIPVIWWVLWLIYYENSEKLVASLLQALHEQGSCGVAEAE